MSFQPNTRLQPEMPLCQRGGNIWLNHKANVAGRCEQCGAELPRQVISKKPPTKNEAIH